MEEREENKKELLDKVEVLWEESLPKGILYLADSNTVISLSKEAAKLVYQKKQQYLSGKLPNDQLQILERKLEETVGKNAASFLKPATTYEEKRGLKSLEILVHLHFLRLYFLVLLISLSKTKYQWYQWYSISARYKVSAKCGRKSQILP